VPRPPNVAVRAALDHPGSWFKLPGSSGLTNYYRQRGFEVVFETGYRYIRWPAKKAAHAS